jgi:Na+/melibiose symporter-like transporter
MAKWAFITVLLYICLVVIVFVPFSLLVALPNEVNASNVLGFYTAWQFWLVCGIITAIQALMLLFPVKTTAEAPKPQRLSSIKQIEQQISFSF